MDSYVELLEQQQAQLVSGLQQLYRRVQTGQAWSGPPLQDSGNGHPLTHDILERLGALKSEVTGESESFEEDLGVMQQKLIESGPGFTGRQDQTESDSEHAQTPTTFLGLPSPQPILFNDPFVLNQLPPTPPTHSPYPRQDHCDFTTPMNHSLPQRGRSRASVRASMNPAALHQHNWASPAVMYEEHMDYVPRLEVPTMCQGIQGNFNRHMVAMNTLSPRIAMPDWSEEDFSSFLNPTIMT